MAKALNYVTNNSPAQNAIAALGRLFNWGFFASLLFALAAIALAYQVRPSYSLAMGGPLDAPYLEGVNAGERDPVDNTVTYRWTTGDAWIKLPGIGSQDLVVRVELAGARPEQFAASPVVVSVAADRFSPKKELATWNPTPGRATYTIEVSRHDIGPRGLFLNLHTVEPFVPLPDPRELGVVMFKLDAVPGVAPDLWIDPPISELTNLLAGTALLLLVLALCGWGSRALALFGVVWALGLAGFVSFNRTWLALAEPGLLQALVAALILVPVLRLLLPYLLRIGGISWPERHRAVLLTIFALAFVIRFAGQMHPEIYIVDLMFHSNRFNDVLSGKLLFTIRSAEWNNRETFYLPTVYVIMLPLRWLLQDNNNILTIRLFTCALDSLGVFLLYYLGRRAMGSGRAGLLGAGLYVTLPMAVLPFSWGITSNVFGQFMALAVATLAVAAYGRLNKPPVWIALVALLCLALLSHPGTVQLTGVLVAALIVVWALRSGVVGPRRGWLLLGGALVTATVLVVAIYYSHFVESQLRELQATLAERANEAGAGFDARVGGSLSDRSLGLRPDIVHSRSAWIIGGLQGFVGEAWAFFRGAAPIWAALGFIALPLVRQTKISRRLAWGAAAWAGTVFLFAVVGLVANLYVRYSLFALPVVALGAGYLLDQLWRRATLGRLMALVVAASFVVEALAFWYQRIQYAFK